MSEANPRAQLERCYAGAVRAVEPGAAMRAALAGAAPPEPGRPVYIIAAGKAAIGMSAGLIEWLGGRGVTPAGGVVVADAVAQSPHPALQHLVGEHPIPGGGSREAAEAIHQLIGAIPSVATIHVLVSGGASALMAGPLPGLAMDDITQLFQRLLESGLAIDEMNALRKRVTRWSAGRLAIACHPTTTHCWVMSDVPGDSIEAIASGPCVADSWTTAQVSSVLDRHDLRSRLPPGLQAAFTRETPKTAHVPGVPVTIVASNALARSGAANAGRELGFVQRVAGLPVSGEASDAGRSIARDAMRAAQQWHAQNAALVDEGFGDRVRPLLMVWGGETTVTLGAGAGRGGRCQELALAAAAMLEVSPYPVTILAAGTDGRDGPTDAAGAIVDCDTWGRIAAAGVDASNALASHDAYAALDTAGALLRTGPTGTNVTDIILALIPMAAQGDRTAA